MGAAAVLELLLWATFPRCSLVDVGQDLALGWGIPTLVQTSVHTCTATRTFTVGSSKPSAAVPFVAINKHGRDWLQPGQVPAPLCLLSFLG